MEQFSLEKYLENPNRKVVTRDGRSVRIICTNRKRSSYPIVALIENKPTKGESVLCYTKEGKMSLGNSLSDADLFFAPEKHEGWINLYKSGIGWSLGANIWQTEAGAKKWTGAPDHTVTLKIEWED